MPANAMTTPRCTEGLRAGLKWEKRMSTPMGLWPRFVIAAGHEVIATSTCQRAWLGRPATVAFFHAHPIWHIDHAARLRQVQRHLRCEKGAAPHR